jgi:hypothetical protein
VKDRQRGELVEVRGKRTHHFANDPTVDLAQHVFDPRPVDGIWRTVPERYVEGWGVLHVHFRVSVGGIGERPSNFCAAFHRSPVGLDVKDSGVVGGIWGHVKGEGSGVEKAQVGESVLILVRKLVEVPEEVAREVIPSSVRLRTAAIP